MDMQEQYVLMNQILRQQSTSNDSQNSEIRTLVLSLTDLKNDIKVTTELVENIQLRCDANVKKVDMVGIEQAATAAEWKLVTGDLSATFEALNAEVRDLKSVKVRDDESVQQLKSTIDDAMKRNHEVDKSLQLEKERINSLELKTNNTQEATLANLREIQTVAAQVLTVAKLSQSDPSILQDMKAKCSEISEQILLNESKLEGMRGESTNLKVSIQGLQLNQAALSERTQKVEDSLIKLPEVLGHLANIDERDAMAEKRILVVEDLLSSNKTNMNSLVKRMDAIEGHLDSTDKKIDDVGQESSMLKTRQAAQDKTIKVQNEMIMNFQEVAKMHQSSYKSQFDEIRSQIDQISAEMLKIPLHDKLIIELQSSVSTLDVVGKKISDLAVSTAAVVHSTKEELAASVSAVEKKLLLEMQSQPKTTSTGVDKGWQQVIEGKLTVHEYQLTTSLNELAEFKKEVGKLNELNILINSLKEMTQAELKSIREDLKTTSIGSLPLPDANVSEKVKKSIEDLEASIQKHKEAIAKTSFDVKSDMMESMKDFVDGLKANLHTSMLAFKADNLQVAGELPLAPPTPVDLVSINKRIDALRYLIANRDTSSLTANDFKLELTDINTICDLQTVNIHSVLKEVRQLLDDVKAESTATRSDAERFIDASKSKLEVELMEKCHQCITGVDINQSLKEEILSSTRRHIRDVHNNIVTSFNALTLKGRITNQPNPSIGNSDKQDCDQVMQDIVRDYLLSLQTLWVNEIQQKCDHQIDVKLQVISEALWEDITVEKQLNGSKTVDDDHKEDISSRSDSELRSGMLSLIHTIGETTSKVTRIEKSVIYLQQEIDALQEEVQSLDNRNDIASALSQNVMDEQGHTISKPIIAETTEPKVEVAKISNTTAICASKPTQEVTSQCQFCLRR